MKNTDHFKRKEFLCRCGCGKEEMKQGLIDRLELFRAFIEKEEKRELSITVTSGFRCVEYNKKLYARLRKESGDPKFKTAKRSPHLRGSGVDIICPKLDIVRLYELAELSKLFPRIGVNRHKEFLHVDIEENKPPYTLRRWYYDKTGKVKPLKTKSEKTVEATVEELKIEINTEGQTETMGEKGNGLLTLIITAAIAIIASFFICRGCDGADSAVFGEVGLITNGQARAAHAVVKFKSDRIDTKMAAEWAAFGGINYRQRFTGWFDMWLIKPLYIEGEYQKDFATEVIRAYLDLGVSWEIWEWWLIEAWAGIYHRTITSTEYGTATEFNFEDPKGNYVIFFKAGTSHTTGPDPAEIRAVAEITYHLTDKIDFVYGNRTIIFGSVVDITDRAGLKFKM